MKLFVTGIRGYLGTVLEAAATEAGWSVDGVDLDLYGEGASAAEGVAPSATNPRADFRDITIDQLAQYDAVVHLAAISSDAACDLRVAPIGAMNCEAAIHLARRAKRAGVHRFVFASSCSVYGAAPDRLCTEASPCAPISAYARAKLLAERGIEAEASSTFSATALRMATLYGLSPNLRSDLVVNAMVASAHLSGEINVHGTGRQCRPLLHVRDAASSIVDVLGSRDEEMCGRTFNVTDESTGYSIADIADAVRRSVPGTRVVRQHGAIDRRHYRVDGSRLRRLRRRTSIRLEDGIAEVSDALAHGADWQRRAAAHGSNRARRLNHLLQRGELSDDVRWRT